jgi:hypothetical protein
MLPAPMAAGKSVHIVARRVSEGKHLAECHGIPTFKGKFRLSSLAHSSGYQNAVATRGYPALLDSLSRGR